MTYGKESDIRTEVELNKVCPMNDVGKYARANELAFWKWMRFGDRLIREGRMEWGQQVHRRSNRVWGLRHEAAIKQIGPLPAAPLPS